MNNLKINAPTLAYKCVYNTYPKKPLYGISGSSSKLYNGLYVDSFLDTKILDELNSIDGIELRSVCSGHSKDRVTHIIFRPTNQNLNHIKHIVNQLNFDKTKCIYDVGKQNMYRICVATRNWYRENANNDNLESWWKMIPDKIKFAITN